MNCHQLRDLFSEYATGSLPKSLGEAAKEHFLECPDCQEAYKHFASTLRLLDNVCDVKPPANLHSLIMASVEKSKVTQQVTLYDRVVGWFDGVSFRNRTWLPPRAVATGMALLAVFALVNGFFPVKPAVNSLLQTADKAPTQVKPAVVASKYGIVSTGLTISAKPSAANVLSVSLGTTNGESTPYRLVYLDSGQTVMGTVGKDKDAVVSITSTSGSATVARVDWTYKGKAFSRNIVVPGKIDAMGSGKRISAIIAGSNALETLRSIANAYGVAIVTSGDMSGIVPSAEIAHGTPDEAFYNTVARAGYSWRQIDSSVYLVEPKA